MTNQNEAPGTTEGLVARVRRGRPPATRVETSGVQREPEGRGARVPLGVRKAKLNAEKREGYVPRWINDDGDRIAQALQGGWDFVLRDSKAATDDMGNRISRVVGSKSSGGQLTAYLMEIREDWYQQDQAEKSQKIKATESLIKRGELRQKIGTDGEYVPARGIKFTRA